MAFNVTGDEFFAIEDGSKIYIAIRESIRELSSIGDDITFTYTCNPTPISIKRRLSEIRIYSSIEAALDEICWYNIVPFVRSKKEAMQYYKDMINININKSMWDIWKEHTVVIYKLENTNRD